MGPECEVSTDLDGITLVNMLKPQLFVSNVADLELEEFCRKIGIPFEREPFTQIIEILSRPA